MSNPAEAHGFPNEPSRSEREPMGNVTPLRPHYEDMDSAFEAFEQDFETSEPETHVVDESIFDLIPDGIATLDESLVAHSTNRPFRHLFGIDVTDVHVALADHPLIATRTTVEEDTMTVGEWIRKVFITQQPVTMPNVHVVTPGAGTQRYSLTASPWRSRDNAGPRIVLWFRVPEVGRTKEAVYQDEDTIDARVHNLLTALDLITDFNRLCVEVLDMALEVSGGVSGSLMLVDKNGRDLCIAASRGLSGLVQQKTRQRIGEGIAGRVAEKGEPLLLVGRVGDERFRGIGGRPEICSSVCVPVKVGNNVVGVLNLNSRPDADSFGQHTLDRVGAFADHLGTVVDRSQQFQAMKRRSRELTVRAEIEAIAFSGASLESKLEQIVRPVERLLSVDTFLIYLADPAGTCLTLRASSGVRIGSGDITVPFGKGVPGWVAEHKSPLILRGHREGEDGQSVPQLASVAVPIRNHGDIIGVIVIEDSSGPERDNETLQLASSIASAIGLVILDAKSQDDSKRKLTMLSALSEMGVAMTDSQDRASFAKLTAYCAATILESDIALVRLARDMGVDAHVDARQLGLLATHGTSAPRAGEPLQALEERLIEAVVECGRPCRDLDIASPDLYDLMQNAQVSGALCVPLVSGRDLIGAITVFNVGESKEAHARDHEVELGNRLGDYATAAARRFVGRDRNDESDESSM